MLNMDQTTLTPRKLEALVAAYLGGYPWFRVGAGGLLYEDGIRSRAGGAQRRMVDELRLRQYLDKGDKLTLKGYDAIITHVSGRLASYIDRGELAERREDRRIFEATEAVRFEQEQNRRKAERQLRAHAERMKKLDALRKLFAPGGEAIALFRFDPTRGVLFEADDDTILTIADRIAHIVEGF